jgi:hypothetical protein
MNRALTALIHLFLACVTLPLRFIRGVKALAEFQKDEPEIIKTIIEIRAECIKVQAQLALIMMHIYEEYGIDEIYTHDQMESK